MTTARVYRIHAGRLAPVTTTDYTARPQPAEPAAYTELHVAAATAALYAGALGFHTPQRQWTGMSDGRATALLDDGTRLIYASSRDSSASSLTACRTCPHGRLHTRPVDTPRDLWPFAGEVGRCTAHAAAHAHREVG